MQTFSCILVLCGHIRLSCRVKGISRSRSFQVLGSDVDFLVWHLMYFCLHHLL